MTPLKSFLPAFLLIAMAVACSKEELLPTVQETKEDTPEVSTICSVVLFDEQTAALLEEASNADKIHTKSMGLNDVLDELGAVSFERVFPHAGEYEGRTVQSGLHRWYIIHYSQAVPLTRAEMNLGSLPGVVSIEKPRKIRKTTLPNDPMFKWQWNLHNDRSLNLNVWYNGLLESSNQGCDINVQEVWEKYTTGNSSVIVAVNDSGLDFTHPDLQNALIAAGPGGSCNFATDKSANRYKITPEDHGTHVAGIIAGIRNNGIGIAGIAGGDYASGIGGVRLLGCQIFTDPYENFDESYYTSGSYAAITANAIKWGADHGAVISQNSWGYDYERDKNGYLTAKGIEDALSDGISDLDRSAIDYFIKYAGCDDSGNQRPDSPMKGGVVIFASGNDNISNGAPANYEPIIAVGAIGPDWKGTWYSNYGDWVDISAPGGDGYGAGWGGDNDGISSRGCILSTFSPSLNLDDSYPGESYGYLCGTSMACPHVSGAAALIVSLFGGPGFTNQDLCEALLGGANREHMGGDKAMGPALDVAGAFRQAGISQGGDDNIAPDRIESYQVSADCKKVNFTLTVPGDSDDGKAFGVLCIIGTDREEVENCIVDKLSPTLKATNFSIGSHQVGNSINLTVSGLKYSTTYYTAIFSYDRHLKYSSISPVLSVTTPANRAPVQTGAIDDMVLWGINDSKTVSLEDLFTDPDMDPMRYGFHLSNTTPVFVSYEDNADKLSISALEYGKTEITIEAVDEDGLGNSLKFRVLVKDKNKPVELSWSEQGKTLEVLTGEAKETYVRLVSSTGKTVYEGTSIFSGLDPLLIDFQDFAPGRYSATIRLDGKEYKQYIVKT